jgi:DNA repair exonuclease SbcCD nuclease subunit
MTRFLFLTDTHIGASPIGFHQQSAYPEHAGELVKLAARLAEVHSADFVLHGGDIVDSCTAANIVEAKRIFSEIPLPLYLSLGNHDLDQEDALSRWLASAPEWFPGKQPQYDIHCDSCVIHVVPNQWEKNRPYYWRQAQEPFFTSEQLDNLRASLRKDPGKTHILSVHNPIMGVPTSQTGVNWIIHAVPEPFCDIVINLMREFTCLKLVLSGHNHINTLIRNGDGLFVSGSSFVETPFECKLIEITDHMIRIETLSCNTSLSFQPSYDETRAYVQGKEEHRRIDCPL